MAITDKRVDAAWNHYAGVACEWTTTALTTAINRSVVKMPPSVMSIMWLVRWEPFAYWLLNAANPEKLHGGR